MRIIVKLISITMAILALTSCQMSSTGSQTATAEFSIKFAQELSLDAQDGRLLLMLSSHDGQEPRFLVNNNADTSLFSVAMWTTGKQASLNKSLHPH